MQHNIIKNVEDYQPFIGEEAVKRILKKAKKVQVWYDNEFGYSRRLLDTIERLPV